MQLTSNSSTPSHLPPIHRLLALHLLRAREKAGLSRAQMAAQTDFSLQDIENFESGLSMPDIVEMDAWCRASGTSLTEFSRELHAALSAEEAEQEANRVRAQQAKSSVHESGVPKSGSTESNAIKVQILCFVPDLPPKLLAVENASEIFEAIEFLLGTTRVRVFATDSSTALGFSAADSTQEETAIADDGGEYTVLCPTENFLVLAGEFEGAEVLASAPRNEDLSWAPLVAWVPLCPHALDLANEEDRKRLRLGSLSPLQVELVLDKFAPQLLDGAVEQIMSSHPDGKEWMAEWND